MDFTLLDQTQEQFTLLGDYTEKLRRENFDLKSQLRSLESEYKKAAHENNQGDLLKEKHSRLIETNDRLIMERELLSKKVEQIIGALDKALKEAEA